MTTGRPQGHHEPAEVGPHREARHALGFGGEDEDRPVPQIHRVGQPPQPAAGPEPQQDRRPGPGVGLNPAYDDERRPHDRDRNV